MGLLSVFVFFLVISSGSIFAVAVFRRKFTELLPVTCAGIVLILYIAGLLHVLSAGVYAVFLISAGLIGYSVFHVLRNRCLSSFLKFLYSPDFLLFVLLCGIFLLGSYGMKVTYWDDCTHWADTVQEMVRADCFTTAFPERVLFPHYPPGMSLLQYFCEKVFLLMKPGGEFSEWRLFLVYKVYLLSMMAPLFRNLRYKRVLGILFAGGAALFTPRIMSYYYFDSTMMEPFLGTLAGIGLAYLILYKNERVLRILSVSAVSFSLVMAKDAGLLFAVFLCAAMVLADAESRNPKKMLSFLIPAACACFARVSFSLHLAAYGISSGAREVSLSDFTDVILNRNQTWMQEVWNNFFPKLFRETISFGYFDFELSYFVCFLLLLAFFAAALFLVRKILPEDFKTDLKMAVISVIQLVFYLVGLAFSYLVYFTQKDALRHASFERYVKAGYMAMVVLLVCIVLQIIHAEGRFHHLIAAVSLAVLLLFSALVNTWSFISREFTHHSEASRWEYDILTTELKETLPEDSHIFFICYDDNGMGYQSFRYLMKPLLIQQYYLWYFKTPEQGGSDPARLPKRWLKRLSREEFDYVYLYQVNDFFRETFLSLFESPEMIRDRQLYRVDLEQKKLIPIP